MVTAELQVIVCIRSVLWFVVLVILAYVIVFFTAVSTVARQARRLVQIVLWRNVRSFLSVQRLPAKFERKESVRWVRQLSSEKMSQISQKLREKRSLNGWRARKWVKLERKEKKTSTHICSDALLFLVISLIASNPTGCCLFVKLVLSRFSSILFRLLLLPLFLVELTIFPFELFELLLWLLLLLLLLLLVVVWLCLCCRLMSKLLGFCSCWWCRCLFLAADSFIKRCSSRSNGDFGKAVRGKKEI